MPELPLGAGATSPTWKGWSLMWTFGLLMLLAMVFTVVIALGFGIALFRGVLAERRRSGRAADEPPRR